MPEVERVVLTSLEKIFQTGERRYSSIGEFVENNDHFRSLLEWRAAQIAEFSRSLRKRCSLPILRNVEADSEQPDKRAEYDVLFDGIVETRWACRNEEASGDHSPSTSSNARKLHVALNMGGVDLGPRDSAELVRTVSEVVQQGATEVIFDEYGSLPLSRIGWIRQAVRKAQRDAG
jgi:hypothetical protein